MELGDGGHESLDGGLVMVDAIMHWVSTFFFGIHMVLDFLFIGFCIVLHSLIGFCLFGVCLLGKTCDFLGCGFLVLCILKLASTLVR